MQAELRRHLADFAGPCLLVTHDPLEALVLADRLVVLEDGRVVQEGTPAQVARRPATDYVARLVGLNLYAGRRTVARRRARRRRRLRGARPRPARRRARGACARPSIVVSTAAAARSSARNTWPATITGLTLLADRVRLEVEGEPAALVDVTPAAVADLALRPGTEVWLAVKATELEVYPQRPGA